MSLSLMCVTHIHKCRLCGWVGNSLTFRRGLLSFPPPHPAWPLKHHIRSPPQKVENVKDSFIFRGQMETCICGCRSGFRECVGVLPCGGTQPAVPLCLPRRSLLPKPAFLTCCLPACEPVPALPKKLSQTIPASQHSVSGHPRHRSHVSC